MGTYLGSRWDTCCVPAQCDNPTIRMSNFGPILALIGVGSNSGDGEAAHNGVLIRRDRLDLELFRRGWTAADLAQAARVSPATISGARHGHRVSPRTLRRLALALTAAPTIAGVDELLGVKPPA
jgi:hypothetical protein